MNSGSYSKESSHAVAHISDTNIKKPPMFSQDDIIRRSQSDARQVIGPRGKPTPTILASKNKTTLNDFLFIFVAQYIFHSSTEKYLKTW